MGRIKQTTQITKNKMNTKLATIAIAALAGVKAGDAPLHVQGAVFALCEIGEPQGDGLWGKVFFKQEVSINDALIYTYSDVTNMRARFFGLDPEVTYTLKLEEEFD